MNNLPQSFYNKKVELLAQDLLGCKLMYEKPEGITSGIIVETEAYHQSDEASHTYSGKTSRNRATFGPGGHAYIYFTYGMHWCFNVTAEEDGIGAGVLIRALEPVDGIVLMKSRRDKEDLHNLCSGPSKLVQAMGISKEDYGTALYKGKLFIAERNKQQITVLSGPRVGIKKAVEKPWRFWIKDNSYISR